MVKPDREVRRLKGERFHLGARALRLKGQSPFSRQGRYARNAPRTCVRCRPHTILIFAKSEESRPNGAWGSNGRHPERSRHEQALDLEDRVAVLRRRAAVG